MPPGGMNAGTTRVAQRRRDEFLEHLRHGSTITDACHKVGWNGRSAYFDTRSRRPDFAAAADEIIFARKHPDTWTEADGFAGFRRTYLGRDSPWFHLLIIDAIQSMRGGEVLMILIPPRHAKTAIFEDWCTYMLCTNPDILITIGSEKIRQAEKVAGNIRARLDHGAKGMGAMHRRFGPFAPPKGEKRDNAAAQAWSRGAFNVAKKSTGLAGERDFNMQALGMTSSVIGTRCDFLLIDDPQSRRSLLKENNTEALVDSFRQDWLSRLGPEGRTVILGNRVGEGDFYEYLLEKTNIVDRLIQIPAWDPAHGGWLWPELYSQEYYLAKREDVGPDAWDRNFMQIGVGGRDATFTEALIVPCKDARRSVTEMPPRPPEGGESRLVIGVDPGTSKASFHVAAMHPDQLVSLDLRLLENAKSYGVFGDVVDELCRQFQRPGISSVEAVVVETKAFQSLLINDPAMRAAQARWNFRLVPFLTGAGKNEPDYGVPQVARMMERGEISFPDADEVSQQRYAALYYQMRRWRPGVRGNKLEQDHVMTLWFCSHYWWQQRRTLAAVNARQFDFAV